MNHDHLNDIDVADLQTADAAAYALTSAISTWHALMRVTDAEGHCIGALMDALGEHGFEVTPKAGAYFTVWSWHANIGRWLKVSEGNVHRAMVAVQDCYADAAKQSRAGCAYLAHPGPVPPVNGPLVLNVRVTT